MITVNCYGDNYDNNFNNDDHVDEDNDDNLDKDNESNDDIYDDIYDGNDEIPPIFTHVFSPICFCYFVYLNIIK